jgi:antitoxin component YwqK of YwqJK toxin-antitoxin module
MNRNSSTIYLIFVLVLFLYSLNCKQSKTKVITEYYPNGNKKSTTLYKNNKIVGIQKEYFENGQIEWERSYKNGKFDGISKGYLPSGELISIINYKNGLKDGFERYFYENEQIESERFFKNNNLEGRLREFYKSGQLKLEEFYKNGKQEGKSIKFYENGQFFSKEFFKNGIHEGYQKFYYPSQLKGSYFYKNGNLFGEFIRYDIEGNIIMKKIYDEKGDSNDIIDWDEIEFYNLNKVKNLVLSTNDYIIYIENFNEIVVLNQSNLSITRKKIEFNIANIETCKSKEIVNIGQYDPKSYEYKNFIYDIRKNELFEINRLRNEWNEKRWSPDGLLTYLNNDKSITIIESKYLHEYLINKEVPIVVTIKGDADLNMRQVGWIGNFFVYGCGCIGQHECWGMYDLKLKKNYFIDCCGIYFKNSKSCDLKIDANIINKMFVDLIINKKLIEIPTNFFESYFKNINK